MSAGEDDDPQLRSLRAVWLSLPDEDPPDRGFAQLMAAARVKAEEMAKPSAWRRLIELLRRPSMLAVATILVLIGGAVIISERGDKLETAQPTLSNHGDTTTTLDRQTEAPAVVAPGSVASGAVTPAIPVDLGHAKPEPPPITDPTPPPARHRPPMSVPNPPRKMDDNEVSKFGKDHAEGRGALGGGPPIEAKPDKTSKGSGLETNKTPTKTDAKVPASTTKQPPVSDDFTRQPSVGGVDSADEPMKDEKKPAGAAISQLLAQCRSAATRGDCTAVRAIAQRIAKTNATFYRDHVSKDATINKCLAAAAAE